ncbi:hypothetical protein A2943_02935 [Candidatus Adlerbacteria bacterium RIFCSPLOWO2_01_FULL_51_16]|uniref:Transglycosylase SLT domain-containing protein n=1 Tax=Candidatus Adlerbacteria bacterium RIFCSPLOWO2_01_FULL_51_16 TaxID=1797243 RepID=A0A1F4XGU0_9BACT|nr:MAG: hypothetical protein A2943_02935 [Candidatus Adlerbacteria bacterium RIFCSPLOWO2_01_FULL_51_16]
MQFRAGLLFFALAPLMMLVLPLIADAQSAGGLVSCTSYATCNLCAFGQLIQNIINYAIVLSVPLVAVLVGYAGFLYFTSGANPGNVIKAKGIFATAFIGFLIAISGWLVVNTILHALMGGSGYFKNDSWFTITCEGTRVLDLGVEAFLSRAPTPQQISSFDESGFMGPYGGGPIASCGEGYSLVDDKCYDAFGDVKDPEYTYSSPKQNTQGICSQGYELQQNETEYWCQNPNDPNDWQEANYYLTGSDYFSPYSALGDCSADTLSSAWGDQSYAFSCIASRESSCNASLGSRVDRTSDGYSFSYGLYQVNMSVRSIQCSNFNEGQPVNCANAFQGKNYNARVVNVELYNTCRTMLQNVQCNTEMAQRIYEKEGYGAWRNTATQCGLI